MSSVLGELVSANRVTQQTDPFGMVLNATYDDFGNVTQLTDNAGGTLTSVYNADNQLTSRRFSETGAQASIDLTYTQDGQIATESQYSNTAGTTLIGTITDTYDKANQITEIKAQNATPTTLEDFQYSYNDAGLVTSETDTISGTGTTINYSYDASNQLTAAGSSNWSFDANGNRTNTGYVTGPDNQLQNDGTWAYAYDNNGNVSQKVGDSGTSEYGYTWQYAFDNANRIISATEIHSGTVVVQELNYYAVNGNRVEQDVTQSGTTTVTHFAYDLSGNVLADLNSSNAVQARRLFLDATDSVFARLNGSLDFYVSDHLGSIRGLENTSGGLDDAISYDAWGNITSESSPAHGDRYKFTGREWDSTLGLEYNRARYYDPNSGRWMSQDPLGFEAGDSNLYRYVSNRPDVALDPSGLESVTISVGGKGGWGLNATLSGSWDPQNMVWNNKQTSARATSGMVFRSATIRGQLQGGAGNVTIKISKKAQYVVIIEDEKAFTQAQPGSNRVNLLGEVKFKVYQVRNVDFSITATLKAGTVDFDFSGNVQKTMEPTIYLMLTGFGQYYGGVTFPPNAGRIESPITPIPTDPAPPKTLVPPKNYSPVAGEQVKIGWNPVP